MSLAVRLLTTALGSPEPALTSRFIAALHHELCTQIILTTVTTSTMNAIADGQCVLSDVGDFLPPHPILFASVKSRHFDDIDSDSLPSTEAFYRFLAVAKRNYATPFAAAPITSDSAASVTLVRQRAVIWQSVSQLSLDAIRELDALVPPLSPDDSALLIELSRLVRDVCAGRSPCTVQGRSNIPRLLWLRKYPRRMANLSAVLSTGSTTTEVLLTDISQGGCGIASVPRLPDQAPVTLTLRSGRVLSGTIQWQRPRRAGILFPAPLRPTDPLISAG